MLRQPAPTARRGKSRNFGIELLPNLEFMKLNENIIIQICIGDHDVQKSNKFVNSSFLVPRLAVRLLPVPRPSSDRRGVLRPLTLWPPSPFTSTDGLLVVHPMMLQRKTMSKNITSDPYLIGFSHALAIHS